MQPALVACHLLDGVAEGMPIVEQRARALLPFVALYDHSLDRHGAGDGFTERVWLQARQRVGVRLQKGEIVGVQRDAKLDAFSPAFDQLSLWQRQQERWIGEDEARRIKC